MPEKLPSNAHIKKYREFIIDSNLSIVTIYNELKGFSTLVEQNPQEAQLTLIKNWEQNRKETNDKYMKIIEHSEISEADTADYIKRARESLHNFNGFVSLAVSEVERLGKQIQPHIQLKPSSAHAVKKHNPFPAASVSQLEPAPGPGLAFTPAFASALAPQSLKCKAPDCNVNHDVHYCDFCNILDSDHRSKNCPKRHNGGSSYLTNKIMYNKLKNI